jgi:hypothetical protein
MEKQRGVTLVGVIVIGVVVLLVVVLATKIIPSAIEYQAVVRSINSVSSDTRINEMSDTEIRAAFSRYAQVDHILSVSGKDLKISRAGGKPVISFSYEKRIPLISRASLVIDYSGSSK